MIIIQVKKRKEVENIHLHRQKIGMLYNNLIFL